MKFPCKNSAQSEYESGVAASIADQCRHVGSFAELIGSLPGIYPSEVLTCLRQLGQATALREGFLEAIEKEVSAMPSFVPHDAKKIVLEHPLDFEWRFTKKGISNIFEELRLLSFPRGAGVLCLGCPSIYLASKNLSDLRFHLWDKNGTILGQLEESTAIASLDLREDPVPEVEAAAAILDPPWYPAFYRLFVWAAAHRMRNGSFILLSFPPKGTRQSAANDFLELDRWCKSIGLVLEKKVANYLPYRSPLFEVNALKVEGINNCPLNWRKGDLLIYRKIANVPFDRPRLPSEASLWKEVRVRDLRIKVSLQEMSSNAILDPVGPFEILGTVSSRDSLRSCANVVTSGNRFLKTGAPGMLIDCFKRIALAVPEDLVDSTKSGAEASFFNAALRIVRNEQREAFEYFQRINGL
jgi:hypothetical protein